MRFLVLAALPFALAACQQSSDKVTTADAEGSAEPATTPTPGAADPTDAGTATSSPVPIESATGGTGASTIPTALQGRWGMVPADCTSTRGDAKGLLTITGTALRFYESVGRLGAIEERSESAIRADYAFTGEGMNWTRNVTLSVAGNKLTRLDRGGDEPGGPFTYTKCPA